MHLHVRRRALIQQVKAIKCLRRRRRRRAPSDNNNVAADKSVPTTVNLIARLLAYNITRRAASIQLIASLAAAARVT